MVTKPGRLVVNLSQTPWEGLAALAELTGKSPELLANRVLASVLTAIAVSMETESDLELSQGSVFPGHIEGAHRPRVENPASPAWPPSDLEP